MVAHFMLGNTYPFTEKDWLATFDLASEAGLDGFALNLGPEEWQFSQALMAYDLLSSHSSGLKLFLSLDMNVNPSATSTDGDLLAEKVLRVLSEPAQLKWDGRPVLSSFSGHAVSFGGEGWKGWLNRLNAKSETPVFFWPTFFMPPKEVINLPYVDGTFAWNAAWSVAGNHTISIEEDAPFLASDKPYMASASPLFFTHYGKTGQWAWDKNWIYRSDDLLYPTRLAELISLPTHQSPSIIQIISWNDYGESHYLSPILGAQPGSDHWTQNMSHIAFREMTHFFSLLWKGVPEIEAIGNDPRVYMWYRTHPSSIIVKDDEVGLPRNSEWAQDLINLFILLPPSTLEHKIVVKNEDKVHERSLKTGKPNLFTVGFKPGRVTFELVAGSAVLVAGQGKRILDEGEIEGYNYNMWSGSWRGD
ncbi:hypothetical protein TREMEDRAFT_37459 [Tremella mesenterica DSM 1558]|uniref:uncharacterized protein n=1 Tax=Tremella mesenterica (strain ATCC 24925 / CBS 8224 / DSM 1558 / NBRC 9311 / NRRL Y-6157 / RJB 2259-6 / UBC 559-6) TaxID=578456 RepID=UPI0003F49286|nr:uncharacterized protein TREMEDRAFT_37459 [Tremella mesenterica DSM 1558]EIW73683.1 hypothetical protein TREMEDRAFT_37459 [Tremella mesenterica DSM 1558]